MDSRKRYTRRFVRQVGIYLLAFSITFFILGLTVR